MLHHNDRIPDLGKLLEILYEHVVVFRMESDGRFVEDVDDPFESGSDLGGEADPLRFSSGEGIRLPGDGDVIEPDSGKEFEPLDDVLQYILRHRSLSGTELEILEEGDRLPDIEIRKLSDVESVDEDVEELPLQTMSHALLTHDFRGILGDPPERSLILDIHLKVLPLQIRDDSFISRLEELPMAVIERVENIEALVLCTVEDNPLRFP